MKTKADNKQAHLSLVSSNILTGQQEAEIIEYCNWQDGQFGLRSPLGNMADMLRAGLYGIQFTRDPERHMIRILDMVRRHRVVHRAMLAIGKHSRVLAAAYVIARKPAYVDKVFGRLSGIVLSIADDVEELALACRRRAMGQSDPNRADTKLIVDYRIEAQGLYSRATRAYREALMASRAEVVPTVPRVIDPLPHRCRIGSPIHKCPCGAEQ